MGILQELKERRLFFDGGMGSLLQARGLKPGELPETWNIKHPEIIEAIHLEYLRAGADIVTTNTFGANRFKYKKEDKYSVEEIVAVATANAKAAIKKAGHGFVALDLGPTGKLLQPYGTLAFEDACDVYKEVVRAGVHAGADMIIIETMGDSYELKAAVLAAKEESRLPVFATVTLDEKGKMLTGGSIASVTVLLEGLGVDAIGLNCGLGPIQLLPLIKEIAAVSSLPILANPNAGLPRTENGKTVYDIDADGFAEEMKKMAEYASILGGCCGTTPEHIKKTAELCRQVGLPSVVKKERTVISSYSHAVEFGKRPIIIGERINPTGKPKLKQALKDRDLSYILNMAAAQQDAGADVLDVNVGLPGIDEASMMVDVVKELQTVTDLPLQIDTANMEAMERAMRIYNGKPLINSVNGKKEVMDAVFPLVKHYGGVVVALCLDEDGIPETADGRMAVAKKIYERAAQYGIEPKDILIDALCMTVSSDKNSAKTTLETVRRVHGELGGKTILGVSNVSFGLPMREQIHTAFFALALQEGLSAAIINPNSEAMMAVYDSFLVLTAQDKNCERYIERYAKKEAEKRTQKSMLGMKDEKNIRLTSADGENRECDEKISAQMRLKKCILRGIVSDAKETAKEVLNDMEPLDIIHQNLIPALDEVGKEFETGEIFLPQLLMSAEAAKAAFDVLKEHMRSNGQQQEKREKVILAAVEGDIHDIGKNIVKVLLENYGFDVMDLGRDVAPETIIRESMENQVKLVGLSALMTTTVPAMEETICQLKDKIPYVKVMVGGAVLTKDYADSIGADAYCKDAMAAVQYALQVTREEKYLSFL